ncbi:MAG: MFS transporter [Candidatus Aminicenantes bacterium]|nr:MFS transporter [Candidatus Aminicenantes bacterium]
MTGQPEPNAPSEAGAKSTLRTFAAASFLNDLGSDIIYPVWPIFVTTVLKANMAALGFLDGLGEALVSLSQAFSGYYSDKIRRRKIFIWTGYLCGSLSRLGYAIAAVWPHLIPFRILDRIGKIRSAPRDAMVADLSTAGTRGRNFGLLRTMDNMGAVLGVIISIVLLNLVGIRALFALAAIPSLASAGLIFFRVKESRDCREKIFRGMRRRDLDRNLRRYFLANAVFALGAFSYSFLLIFAREAGFKTGTLPVLYLVFTAAAMAFSLPFGKLSDRIGRKPVLYTALGLWALVCGGFVFGRGRLPVLIGMFVIYGMHKAALEPVQRTIVSEICPERFRASALGAFQMIIGLCALPASILAGILWEQFGAAVPFAVSLILTAASAAVLAFVKENRGTSAD